MERATRAASRPSHMGSRETGAWTAALALLGVVVLSLIGVVAAMQRSSAIALPAASAAFDHASTEWSTGERTQDGAQFRWTTQESTLNFRAARRVLPANKRLILTMRFSTRPPGAPVTTVSLLANGTLLDTWPSNVDHPVAVDVTALLRRHDELHVTVRVDRTYTAPGDGRALGTSLVGDARIAARPGKNIPSPDAAISVALLILLAALAGGRRPAIRWRLVAAVATGCVVTLGVLAARVPFWRIAMPLELALAALVIARWAREWWAALTWPLRALQRRLGFDDRILILAGAIIALAGQIMIAQHRGMYIGAVVLFIGLVTALAGLIPTPPASPGTRPGARPEGGASAGAHPSPPDRDNLTRPAGETGLVPWQIVALVGIAALAVALRLTLLTEMPASLFKDEGRHALKAIRILDDPAYRPVYEPEIALPALFLYPMALAFKLFGISVLTLRLFMAAVGVVNVLLFFLLSRRLFGTRVALIAAYLLAVSFWALRMQRVALAPCFSTGLVLLGLFLFVRAIQSRRLWDWALAGIGAAGTVYCYHSGPFTLVFIALVALILLAREPRRFPRYWLPRFALLAAVFLVLAAPLLRYIVLHFDQYSARPGQTAIFSEENLRRLGQDRLAAFQGNIEPNIGMYTVRGDFEPKHNLPDAPHLDTIVAVLFLIGLALALAGRLHGPPSGARRFGEWLALGYLAVMLVPSLLAIDAPNTLRAFDTLPPALLIAALAAEAIWARLFGGAPKPDPSPAARGGGRIALACLALVAILALDTGTYFGLMRHDARETFRFDTYFATQAGKRAVAEARARPGMTFFVPRATIDRDVFPFFGRIMGDAGKVLPLEAANPATLPTRYAILLPNGRQDAPDSLIATLPWAKGLERMPGSSPAGAGGVPAFVEYRTPG